MLILDHALRAMNELQRANEERLGSAHTIDQQMHNHKSACVAPSQAESLTSTKHQAPLLHHTALLWLALLSDLLPLFGGFFTSCYCCCWLS